jgi:molybdate transport system substrate-binding protein
MVRSAFLLTLLVSIFIISACQVIGVWSGDSEVMKTRLVVFAAASLSETFIEIGQGFESEHPDVQVVFNFAGSQQLAHQLSQGAPADVFASANQRQMQAVVQAGLVDAAAVKVFAHNRLVVLYPGDNPGDIHDLADLANPGLKLALADQSVPVGQYSFQFLEKASHPERLGSMYKQAVLGNVVSYEENVRAVLSKVRLGEVDGGVTYASDYLSGDASNAGQLGHLDIPPEMNVLTSYYVAPLTHGDQGELSREFLAYLLSHTGQEILASHGLIMMSSSKVGAGQ